MKLQNITYDEYSKKFAVNKASKTDKGEPVTFEDIVNKEQLRILVKIHTHSSKDEQGIKDELKGDSMNSIEFEDDIYSIGF